MLTPEQVKEFRGQYGIGMQPKPKNVAEVMGFTQRVRQDFDERVESAATAQNEAVEGRKSVGAATAKTIGQGAAFVGDVAFEAVSSIPGVKPTLDALGSKLAGNEAVQQGVEAYSAWRKANPDLADYVEAGGNLLGIAPVGIAAGAAPKIAGKALSATGDALAATGRATEGVGKAVFKSAITPTVKEAERILSYDAKTPFLKRLTGEGAPRLRSDTAFDKGLTGTERMLGTQAKTEANSLYTKKIAPAVESSTVQVTKDDLFAPIAKRIEETTDPSKKKAYQEAFEAIQEDYADSTVWSLEEAQKLKSELDEFTPEKVFRGKSIASEFRTLQNEMADAIRIKTYNALDDVNIKGDYIDYGNLVELQKIGVKAISEAGFKGGFGGFWTAMYDMATTPVKTIGGRVLYRVGDTLEFVGQKGIKNFGDFLQSKGFDRSINVDDAVKSYAANIQPGLSTKAVRIHPDDSNVLAKYIKAVRLKGADAPKMTEVDWEGAERIFQKLGISLDQDLNKLAKIAEKILGGEIDASKLYKTGREFKTR